MSQRSLTWKPNDLIIVTCFNHYYLRSILFKILLPLKVILKKKKNYFKNNCSQVCVEFSYLQLIFPSSSERKIPKGPHNAPSEFSVLEISCMGMRISDALFVGRAVCFPLNTTRLENCKPNGLKACSRHRHTGIQVEALYGVQQRGRRMPGWVRGSGWGVNRTRPGLPGNTRCFLQSEVQTQGHSSKMKILPLFLDYRFRSEKRQECLLFFFKMICFQIYSWEKALGPKRKL